MNAEVRRSPEHIEPADLRLPTRALTRFGLRLGRDRAGGAVADAAFVHAVDPQRLEALVEHWCEQVNADAAGEALEREAWQRLLGHEGELCFVHRRSRTPTALPLLLLHGSEGPFAQLASLAGPLSEPDDHATDAFHVVCPALPGFGVTRGAEAVSVSEVARSCAALMARLGYDRFVVHGSNLGAAIAAEVAALAPGRVIALHVTSLRAYPTDATEQHASLTRAEKSQLGLLSLLHDEGEAPDSPIDELAQALEQLDDWRGETADFEPLLQSLTLAWAFGSRETRSALHTAGLLSPSSVFEAPVALETYPLDAPCLRRFVESRFRLLSVTERQHGGAMPALEAPHDLLASLRRAFAPFR